MSAVSNRILIPGMDAPRLVARSGPTRTLVALVALLLMTGLYMLPVAHTSVFGLSVAPARRLSVFNDSQIPMRGDDPYLNRARWRFAALGRMARQTTGGHELTMESHYPRWRDQIDSRNILLRDMVALMEWMVLASEHGR
tara:strand:- start:906 stop:1325 length:420 start_codon:yes stop_codon:yes gene_type:complete